MKQIIVTYLLITCCYALAAQPKAPVVKKPVTASITAGLPTEADLQKAYRKGDYAKTIALADRRLAGLPGDPATLVVKALSYGMLRNKEMVVKTVRLLYPKSSDTAAIFLATLPANLSKKIMKTDAGWYVKEAHRLSPSAAIPYLMEASYLLDDSLFDKGKTAALAGAALLKARDAVALQMQFANVLHVSGAGDRAYELMDRLEQANPKDTLVILQYYSMLLQDKKYAESLAELNRLIALKPADRRLHKERALLYHDLGRHEDACTEATTLAGGDEDYFALLQKLGCPEPEKH